MKTTLRHSMLAAVFLVFGGPGTSLVGAQTVPGSGPATTGDGLLRNEPGAFQGYTLLAPLRSRTTFLIDMEGRVVKAWESQSTPSSMAYFLENGHLLRPGEVPDPVWGRGAAAGGRLQEFDWDGELVWDFTYATENALPHHDIARLPNGNVIMVVKERVTEEMAIAAGRVPFSVRGTEIQMDSLIEVKRTGKSTGEIVWSWHLKDHLIQDFDAGKANYGDVRAHPERVDINFDRGTLLSAPGATERRSNPDWTHVNAVAYNPRLDQLVVSVHEFSEIWVIDHSTTREEAAGSRGGRGGQGGDLLYRWGNPRAYRAGTEADQRLFAQHDAHWIPEGCPGEGHLMVFNNGNRRPGGNYSSVDEIVMPVDASGRYRMGEDGRFGPDQAVWSYSAPNPPDFYSNFISGASRLPNGNTLICSGANGIMFEVTPSKQVVWQYMNPSREAPGGRRGGGPNGRSLFRAYRYGKDHPGLAGRTLTPGKTLEELSKEAIQQRAAPGN